MRTRDCDAEAHETIEGVKNPVADWPDGANGRIVDAVASALSAHLEDRSAPDLRFIAANLTRQVL